MARRHSPCGAGLVSLEWDRVRDRDDAEGAQTQGAQNESKVALTVDDNTFPHKVLMVRGTAALKEVTRIVPEYELAAHRYFGDVQGAEWIQQARQTVKSMVRISVRPEWVGVLDFQSRFPSTLH